MASLKQCSPVRKPGRLLEQGRLWQNLGRVGRKAVRSVGNRDGLTGCGRSPNHMMEVSKGWWEGERMREKQEGRQKREIKR